jgi:polyhydroxyalkanoate synthase
MQVWLKRLADEQALLSFIDTSVVTDMTDALAALATEAPERLQSLQTDVLPRMLDAFISPVTTDDDWLDLVDQLMTVLPEIANDLDRSQMVWLIRQLRDSDRLVERVQTMLKTKSINVAQGIQHWREDLVAGAVLPDTLRPDTFRLGETLATTPGDVVFENQLFQLIQYRPHTPTVAAHPILLVPAFVNRYYILDLSPEMSMVRWLVSQGQTVFLISWVNPDPRLANYDVTHYVLDGVLAALDQMHRMLQGQPVQLVGYCAGGVLASIAASWLAARDESRIVSLTLLTTLLDYSKAGPLGEIVTEATVEALAPPLQQLGYLPAELLLRTFASLRPTDLMFARWMQSYVLGERHKPTALLHWLGDGTRTPAALVQWILKSLYLDNRLVDGEPLTIAGHSIDLSRLDIPVFLFACERDDIAPWQSALRIAPVFKGPVTCVLGQGGHNSGVICPPDATRYDHWRLDPRHPTDQTRARQIPGSWWVSWLAFLAHTQGPSCAPPVPGGGLRPVLEPAPGRYVKEP